MDRNYLKNLSRKIKNVSRQIKNSTHEVVVVVVVHVMRQGVIFPTSKLKRTNRHFEPHSAPYVTIF